MDKKRCLLDDSILSEKKSEIITAMKKKNYDEVPAVDRNAASTIPPCPLTRVPTATDLAFDASQTVAGVASSSISRTPTATDLSSSG